MNIKKVFFILILAVSLHFSYAQKLDSFWGLKLYMKKDSVVASLKKRIGKIPSDKKDNELIYEDCAFGSYKATIIKLYFEHDSLFRGYFYLVPESDPKIIDFYNDVKNSLTNKWFPPQKDVESYKYPYKKGDGDEVQAIRGGYATIGAIWVFYNSELSEDDNSQITLWLDKSMYLSLYYVDTIITPRLKKKSQIESSSDY